jgi:hypothetical protein
MNVPMRRAFVNITTQVQFVCEKRSGRAGAGQPDAHHSNVIINDDESVCTAIRSQAGERLRHTSR